VEQRLQFRAADLAEAQPPATLALVAAIGTGIDVERVPKPMQRLALPAALEDVLGQLVAEPGPAALVRVARRQRHQFAARGPLSGADRPARRV
jgi:hypothetical protein